MADTSRRVITVFISSTFRDLQVERDQLAKIVFPKLRRMCASRGVTFSEVDLRWGITEEEKAEGRLLPICFQEIDRCRPYFIGLLGGRYGHIPRDLPRNLLEGLPWLAEVRERSITELEILHGVLRPGAASGRAYFYFREFPAEASPYPGEDDEAARKLAQLKNEIRERHKHGRCHLREGFRDARELGEWLEQDFSSLIDSLYPAHLPEDPIERERAEHARLAEGHVAGYVARSHYFRLLDEHAGGVGVPLVLIGEDGAGKTALLANWWLRREAGGGSPSLLAHFADASAQGSGWPSVVRRLLGEFNRRFDLRIPTPEAPEQLRVAFANALEMIAASHSLVLLLDGVDEIEESGGASELRWLPPETPAPVRLVVSTGPGKTARILEERGWKVLPVEPLTPAGRLAALWRYLRIYRKRLSKDLRRRIAGEENCGNPLHLRAVLDELRLHGDYATLAERAGHYLSAGSGAELFDRILDRCERDYGADRPGFVRDALCLLAASRSGLTETELLEILRGSTEERLPQVVWSELRLGLGGAVAERDGRFRLGHRFIREAVEKRYLCTEQERQAAHRRLALYFDQAAVEPRRSQELPWQLVRAREWDLLKRALSEFAFVEAVHAEDGPQCLVEYWSALREATGFTPAEAYRHAWQAAQAEGVGLRGVCNVLGNLGGVALAEEIVAAEIRCLRGLPDQVRRLASELEGYAQFFLARNDAAQARALTEEAIGIWDRLGEPAHAAHSRMALAGVLIGPEPQRALQLVQAAHEWAVHVGDLAMRAASLGNLANIQERLRDLERAIRFREEAIQLCAVRGDRLTESEHKDSLARCLRYRGERVRALELLKGSEFVYRRLGVSGPLGRCLGQQALVLQDLGQFQEALAKNLEAEPNLAGSGQKIWYATCVLVTADLCRAVSNRTLGMEKARLAATLLLECRAPAPMLARARELEAFFAQGPSSSRPGCAGFMLAVLALLAAGMAGLFSGLQAG